MSIVLGAIVGVGGGAIRDSFVGEVPGIFRSSNFMPCGTRRFVTYCIAGSVWLRPDGGCHSLCCRRTCAALSERVFDWKTGDDILT
ncbi:MAG: TRIC cation channel family protein [Slackia sp.]